MESTRQVILHRALALFSVRGYDGVSMRDIAAAVGVKASSLYNHFKSKEDILLSLMEEMESRYNELAKSMPFTAALHDPDMAANSFMGISEPMLVEIASRLFLYFLRDDFAAKYRRMLSMEQYRSTRASEAYQSFLINDVLTFQTKLFDGMIKQGAFIACAPDILSLHFYSPIFLLLSKYDQRPDCEAEALELLRRHIVEFSRVYTKKP